MQVRRVAETVIYSVGTKLPNTDYSCTTAVRMAGSKTHYVKLHKRRNEPRGVTKLCVSEDGSVEVVDVDFKR